MKKFLLGLGLLAFTLTCYAQDLKLTLTLDKIQINKLSEEGADEIYFSVVEFPSNGKGELKTIPEHPLYWSSEHVDKIKNLTLWNNSLKSGQSVEILVSLVEHDIAPWNTDDLLGAFKLQIKNDNGKLVTQWSGKNAKDEVSAVSGQDKQRVYTLVGEGGEYKLYVSLAKAKQ